ncbi:acyltransferase family protein [Pseudomonas nitroreducens]|uniref:acyltransferase family protein n=1 Tax=Pseudomonas nitroreducens TaxID=46680 RepID=UPI002D80A7FD|nr:acyltransferase family protein [Pseudomonas nitroreducens]
MRDARLDNAKGVLIILVVLGHLLESVQGWGNETLRAFLTLIYVFHMPAFVFLAGMTAKQDRLGSRLGNLLILLVMFQAFYVVPATVVKGQYPIAMLQPYWMMWFVLSLMWWLAALPLIRRLKGALPVSIVLAVVAGLMPWDGYILSSGRTLVFLPFFIAGNLYGWQLLARPPVKLAPRLLLSAVAVGAIASIYLVGIGDEWLKGGSNFLSLVIDPLPGITIRVLLLGAAALASWAFMVWLPSSAGFLTVMGANSLAVFLLHGVFVKLCRPLMSMSLQLDPLLTLTVGSGLSVGVAWLLGRERVDLAIRTLATKIQSALTLGRGSRAA